MSLKKAVANALSFASLAGLSKPNGARAESKDDDENKEKDEDAEAEGDDAKAEDEKPKDDDEKGDDKGGKKAKGAKAEDDEKEKEDGDEDDSKSARSSAPAPRAGVPVERVRCKAIVAHGVKLSMAAGGDLAPIIDACMLAFDTDVSASAAIESMDARAAVNGSLRRTAGSLASRMQGEAPPKVRADGGERPAADAVSGTVQMILAAGKKARGEA